MADNLLKEEQTGVAEPGTGTPEGAAQETPPLEETLVFKPEKKKKIGPKVRKFLLWGVLALLALGIGFVIYNLFFKEEETVMQTAFTYYTTIENTVTGSGAATAKETQEIAGLATGKVLEVFVESGDMVKKGDPLFFVDDDEIRDELTSYGETLERAQKDLTALYEERDGQSGRAAFTGKTLNVGSGSSGELAVGDIVSKGQVLGVLVDDSAMRLTTYFSTAYRDTIRVGQSAAVSIPKNMALIPGVVDRVANNTKITDEGTVLFEVEIVMDNPGALTEGLLATATVSTDMGEVTPAEAGKLEYNRKENIKAKTSGELTDIYMRDYYNFEAGAVMFEIYNEDIDSDISAAIKSVEDARERYDNIADQYKYYQPTAEIDGQVLSVSVAVGDELTGSSNTVVQIADMSVMTLEAQIDELDIAKLVVGMPVQVTADSTGMTYEGKLVEIKMQGTVGQGMSTFPVKIEVPNPEFNPNADMPVETPEDFYGTEADKEVFYNGGDMAVSSTVMAEPAMGGEAVGGSGLYPGMWLNFKVAISRVENCLAVPSNAVKYVDTGTVVFVKERDDSCKIADDIDISIVPEGFTAVYVTVGTSDETQIEIVEGLGENMEVATTSASDDPYGGMYY